MKFLLVDLAIIVILAIGIFIGSKKGIIRALVSIVCSIVSLAAAAFITTDTIAENIYDQYMHQHIVDNLSTGIDHLKETAKRKIETYIEEKKQELSDPDKLADTISSIIEKAKEIKENDSGVSIEDRLESAVSSIKERVSNEIIDYAGEAVRNKTLGLAILNEKGARKALSDKKVMDLLIKNALGEDNNAEIADHIEKRYIRPIVVRNIAAAAKVVIFAVLRTVLWMITAFATKTLGKVKPLKQADRTAGALLGFAASAVIVLILTYGTAAVYHSSDGTLRMNNEWIEQTIIFKNVYMIEEEYFFKNIEE